MFELTKEQKDIIATLETEPVVLVDITVLNAHNN